MRMQAMKWMRVRNTTGRRSACSPGGAEECSPRRKPWVNEPPCPSFSSPNTSPGRGETLVAPPEVSRTQWMTALCLLLVSAAGFAAAPATQPAASPAPAPAGPDPLTLTILQRSAPAIQMKGAAPYFVSEPRQWTAEEKDRWPFTEPPTISAARKALPPNFARTYAIRPGRTADLPAIAAAADPPRPEQPELRVGPRYAVETPKKPNPLLMMPMFVRARPEPVSTGIYALDASGGTSLPPAPLFRTTPAPIVPPNVPESVIDGGGATAIGSSDTDDAPESLPILPPKPPMK